MTDSAAGRTHEFHALWWHFGQHIKRDVHLHSCFDAPRCREVLVGPGQDCEPNRNHWRERL